VLGKGATVKPARFCRCENPVRATTAEGVVYCETCEELLPASQDELLAAMARAVAKMSRKLDAITLARRSPPDLGNGPVIALDRRGAAKALAMGPTSFDAYVRPHIRAVRRGKLRLYPVAELERWAEENAERALQ
jgi:hypothetical protein